MFARFRAERLLTPQCLDFFVKNPGSEVHKPLSESSLGIYFVTAVKITPHSYHTYYIYRAFKVSLFECPLNRTDLTQKQSVVRLDLMCSDVGRFRNKKLYGSNKNP